MDFFLKKFQQFFSPSVLVHVSLTTHLNKQWSPRQQVSKCCGYLTHACVQKHVCGISHCLVYDPEACSRPRGLIDLFPAIDMVHSEGDVIE